MTTNTLKILPLILIFAGCSGGVPEYEGQLEPASGTVLVNGKPEANIQVSFIPIGQTQGTGATALTSELGSFSLLHRSGKPGVEAGKYNVVFSKFAKSDGSPIPPEEDAAISGIEHIPPKYSDAERTKEIAEVPAGGKEFQFELSY